MADWLSRIDYVPTERVHSEMFNSLGLDIRNWRGPVNANGNTLSNVVLPGLLTDPTQFKGDLIVRGQTSLTRLGVGQDGYVLISDSNALHGIKWAPGSTGGGGSAGNDTSIQRVRVSSMGALRGTRYQLNFVNTASVTVTAVDNPTNNWVDISFASVSGGGGGSADPTIAKGDLIVRNGPIPSGVLDKLQIGASANGWVLTLDSAQTLGMKWATPAVGFVDPTTAKGDIMVRGNNPPATKLAAGANGYVLTANNGQPLGVYWAAPVGEVPAGRSIAAGYGLTGGGDLSQDRTIAVVDSTTVQKINVSKVGTLVGTQPGLNFVSGSGVDVSVNNDAGNKWINLSFSAAGIEGGLGDPTVYKGDLIVRGEGGITNLLVGEDGQVLTANSNDEKGMYWAAPAETGENQSPWLGPIEGAGNTLTNAKINANHPLIIQGDAGGNCSLTLQQSAANRWAFMKSANAASDLRITRYSDAGSYLDSPITIERATGNIALFHDLTSTGTMTLGGNLQSGGTVAANTMTVAAAIEIGMGLGASGNRLSYIDFHSDDTYTDYSFRIIRNVGVNGATQCLHRGTGDFTIGAQDAAKLSFSTGGAERFYITSDGYTVANAGMTVGGTLQCNSSVGVTGGLQALGHTWARNPTVGTGFTLAAIEIYQSLHPVQVPPIPETIANSPRISFHWTGVVASQIGMDQAGTIRTFDNPGTGYAAFACATASVNGDVNCSGNIGAVGLTTGAAGVISGPAGGTYKFWRFSGNGYLYCDAEENTRSGYVLRLNNGGSREVLHIDNSGNCAIGGFAPVARLHVADARYGPPVAGQLTGGEYFSYDNTWGIQFGHLVGGESWIQSQRSDGLANIYQLYLNPIGGNVGIGVLMPGSGWLTSHSAFSVIAVNPTTAATADQIAIGEQSNNPGYRLKLGYYWDAAGGATYKSVIQSLHGGAGAPLLLNPAGGPIGIQTTTPFSKISFGIAHPNIYSRIAFYELSTGGGFRGIGMANPSGYGVGIYAHGTNAPTDSNMTLFVSDNGCVGINHTAPSSALTVTGDVNVTGNFYRNGVALGSGLLNVYVNNTFLGAASGINFTNGSSSSAFCSFSAPNAAVRYDFISDIRIKRNVRNLEGGLAVIERLRPVAFEHNGALGFPVGKPNVSIITQELREILPDCVYPVKQKLFPDDEEETETLAYDPIHILYHLVLAVQQLKKKLGV